MLTKNQNKMLKKDRTKWPRSLLKSPLLSAHEVKPVSIEKTKESNRAAKGNIIEPAAEEVTKVATKGAQSSAGLGTDDMGRDNKDLHMRFVMGWRFE